MQKVADGSFHPEPVDSYTQLQRSCVRLLGPDGHERPLPGSLSEFLAELATAANRGDAVSLVPDGAVFTTIEASEFLGVSRRSLVGLLEQGIIPYHMVGPHRRIYARDLFDYCAIRDSERGRASDTRSGAGRSG